MDQGKPNWDLLWTNNLLIIDVFLVLIPKWAKLVDYFRPLTHEHSFCKIYLFETLSVILYCLYNLKTLKTPTEEWGEKKFGKRNDSGIFNTTGAYPWLWKKNMGKKANNNMVWGWEIYMFTKLRSYGTAFTLPVLEKTFDKVDLTHFMPLVSFYTPCKRQKTSTLMCNRTIMTTVQ